MNHLPLIGIIGPTASGKSARAIALAQELDGEVISVDSRQVYRTLDIGTEKTMPEEMQGIPHHLINIREPEERYSAGDFMQDAEAFIADIRARGKRPILAGGSHFYFDALLYGLPSASVNTSYREELEAKSAETLFAVLQELDPQRAAAIDPHNKRRLVRALEIVRSDTAVPARERNTPRHTIEWIVVDHPRDVLRERIAQRLMRALDGGLIEEVQLARARLGDERLNELGLEYRIIGEYLAGTREKETLLPALSSRLWRFARQQKQWIKRLVP